MHLQGNTALGTDSETNERTYSKDTIHTLTSTTDSIDIIDLYTISLIYIYIHIRIYIYCIVVMCPKFEDSNHPAKKKNPQIFTPQLFSAIVAAAQVSAGNNRKTRCANLMKMGVSKNRDGL